MCDLSLQICVTQSSSLLLPFGVTVDDISYFAWRFVAVRSRPGGVDSARFDPPEFFSVPAAPFLAARNVATYGDSIFFGVAVGPRGDPWGPVGTRGDPRPIVGPIFTGTSGFSGFSYRMEQFARP